MIITGVSFVKDEAQALRRTLKTTIPFCDNLVVLIDDRTSDGTEKVVEEFGGVCYWNRFVDFGSQRTRAVESAVNEFSDTDWLLMFDGHEEYRGDPQTLRVFLNSIHPKFDGITFDVWVNQIPNPQVRMVKPGTRFKYPVHEAHNCQAVVCFKGITVYHHDEWRSKECATYRLHQKRTFYIDKMTPLALKGETRFIFHLAMTHYQNGDFKKSMYWADRYIGPWEAERFATISYGVKSAIAIQDWDKAIHFISKETFKRPDYFFLKACVMYGRQQYDQAAMYFGFAMVTEMPPNPFQIACNVSDASCKENFKRLLKTIEEDQVKGLNIA